MARRPSSPVPQALVAQIDLALTELDAARADLSTVVSQARPLEVRRDAYARVTRAFHGADQLLREATRLARTSQSHGRGFYRNWREWRHRLSQLDAAKARHLFAQSTDIAVLPMGTVRAIDTGMSGPAIGELVHGHSCAPGAPAHYGLDMTDVLASHASYAASTSTPNQPVVSATTGTTGPGNAETISRDPIAA